jgi:hypothetical protein
MQPPSPLPSAARVEYQANVQPWRFEWWLRAVMIAGGGTLIALLCVARFLSPDPGGFGTHQQLGLPPCSFVATYGRRCPACGMTTSWSHLTRGHVVTSLRVNSGGTLLGLAALVAGPWLLASGLAGRWIGRPPHELVIIGLCVSVTLVILTDWAVRLFIV